MVTFLNKIGATIITYVYYCIVPLIFKIMVTINHFFVLYSKKGGDIKGKKIYC